MTYGLVGSFMATPGQGDRLLAHLLRAAEIMRDDDACLLYVVATTDRPDEVAVVEMWTDEAAHDASLHRDGVGELIAEARQVIAGVAGHTRLTVHGGTGLRS